MGEVWLAHDTLLDRPVAVKFIADFRSEAEVRTQFLVEARAAARLSHPNVVTIHRVGELDGRPFIVSEFIRGKSLDAIEKPMPWKRAIELGIGLARGLAAAHRRGVLHRDIKPGNAIIAEEGDVKLLDFGLAKLVDRGRPAPIDGGSPAARNTPVPRHTPVARTSASTRPPPRRAFRSSPPGAGAFTPDPAMTSALMRELRMRVPSDTLDAVGPGSGERALPHSQQETTPFSASRSGDFVGGTPHYMAPELWWGEPATYRTDVYALGVLLFELCAGKPPFGDLSLFELASATAIAEPPALTDAAPGVDPRLAMVVDRCLRRNPAERFANGEDLREALEELTSVARREAMPEGNPYRGLRPFDADHRPLFFGRSNEIGTVLDRLRSESLVVIAGDSGVGKSSLCGAGVLPRVAEGALGEGRRWDTIRFTPGKRPALAIASALAGVLGGSEDGLIEAICEAPAWIGRDLRRHLGSDKGLLLYVDQLEELVTIAEPEEAPAAAEALFHLAARIPGFRLLCSVRGDFLARVAAMPFLGDELSRALYLLRPLSPEKIREAIVGPARAKGVAFESEALVDKLVASTSRAEGLPLLQFALAELWEARSDSLAPITAEALDAIGGVAGALARHADRVVLGLPAEQREAARLILVDLVSIEGTRAYRTEIEIVQSHPGAKQALDALVRGRLLVAHEWEDSAIYEIAHEALLKGWDTLRRWLDAEDEARIVEQRLVAAAMEWERLGKAKDALWGERQIAETSLVAAERLGAREKAFLAASRSAVRRRKLRTRGVAIGLPALALVLFGAVRLLAQRDLDRKVSANIHEAQGLYDTARSRSAEVEKLQREAFAAFDARRLDEGERLWARAQELAADIDGTYGRSSQVLEAALILDAGREDVRGLLADVLYERALVAERDHKPGHSSDLLARMALYDAEGERRGRWDENAHLTIASVPPGARVKVERYVVDKDRRRVEPLKDLAPAPASDIDLPRGSYLLTFEAEGRAVVRHPVLLGRGERLRIEVDLPRASEIPPGFVYVPAGRFLFGTSLDDSKRRNFLSTVPVHEAQTGSYLIARNEVTYAEWIQYLRALPSEERAKRIPKVGDAALGGATSLRQLEDGTFQLVFRLPEFEHSHGANVAVEGQPITYAARRTKATQNWQRFPVTGISMRDAEAYAAWVRDTGRVKGARLCSEYEWERAARGADDREFPHGDALTPADANFDETYGKDANSTGPDEVGSHPASQSPFGLDDLAGNVFEWTVSSLEADRSVIRGGSYFYDQMTARSTNRTTLEPDLRDPRVGMRLCASFSRSSGGKMLPDR
ncbi:SUMF1/EgtB/PvdO family nonheme iron enzyme [Polyangium aurulentum]|nr:SUMF1/EgtB/PvdO family nonheme iron enzyme [Polyangium aurulentum]